MKLYTDIFTDEEIISDSYPHVEKFDGVIWEVKSRWIVKGEENVDIGCGNAFGGGGEDEQAGGEESVKVLDLVDSFGYEETSHDKASFGAYFKPYMKKVLTHLTANQADRVESFKNGAKEFFKWVNEHVDDISFYTPRNFDSDNNLILSYYPGEDLSPTFVYMMDGLKFTKL